MRSYLFVCYICAKHLLVSIIFSFSGVPTHILMCTEIKFWLSISYDWYIQFTFKGGKMSRHAKNTVHSHFSLPLIYLCNPEFKLKSWKALWWIYMYIALSMDEYRIIKSNWCRVTEEIDGTTKSLQQWLRSNWKRWFVENMIELQKKLILIIL